MKQIWMVTILVLGLLVSGGCRSESQRLADMADRTVEMQSETNTTVASANEELAKLNRDVHAERKELNHGFKQLEYDRRELNQQRRSELAWAESFRFLAIVTAAALPLFLCAFLTWAATLKTRNADLVNEVLIQELVAERPRVIAGPNQPENKSELELRAIESAESHQSNNTNNNGGNDDHVTHC